MRRCVRSVVGVTSADDSTRGRRRLGLGAAIVVVLAALAVTVGIGILRSSGAPVEAVQIAHDEASDAAAPASLYVHVSGAVAAPGLYVLHEDCL